MQGCLGPGSRLVLLVNLSEAGPVSSSTAATLDWMQHLQTLTTARHMSAHTLTHDDSSTMAGGSTALLHPVTSVPHVATCDDLPPPVEAGNSTGRWSEARTDSSAVLPVPAALAGDHPSRNQALVAEVEQLKTRVHDLLVCLSCLASVVAYTCSNELLRVKYLGRMDSQNVLQSVFDLGLYYWPDDA